jgi:hypothetical protein
MQSERSPDRHLPESPRNPPKNFLLDQLKPHFNPELAINFKQRKRKELRREQKQKQNRDQLMTSIGKSIKRKVKRQNLATSQGSVEVSASEEETRQSADLEA